MELNPLKDFLSIENKKDLNSINTQIPSIFSAKCTSYMVWLSEGKCWIYCERLGEEMRDLNLKHMDAQTLKRVYSDAGSLESILKTSQPVVFEL